MVATIGLAVLTATCCALTVALLGALRGVAELRLRLVRAGSVSGDGFRLDSGRVLPELLEAALPAEPTLVGFVSDDCHACRRLMDELDRLALPPDRVVLAVTGKDTGELRRRATASFLPDETAHAAAHELGLDFTPVVIIAANGAVAAVAYGESLHSREELQRLWEQTVRPYTKVH